MDRGDKSAFVKEWGFFNPVCDGYLDNDSSKKKWLPTLEREGRRRRKMKFCMK